MVSAAVRKQHQRIQEAAMPFTLDVVRLVEAEGDGGITTRTPQVVAQAVPCRCAPVTPTPMERLTADQLIEVAVWDVVVPLGTDVRTTDRVIVYTPHPRQLTLEVAGEAFPTPDETALLFRGVK